MNCPYCNKSIVAITGFQEVSKFQKHLQKCSKHPDRKVYVSDGGGMNKVNPSTSLLEALEKRADSGQ